MTPHHRQPAIHHCTSQPLRFFGRVSELALLDEGLDGGRDSVIAMIGPGGQGKTAIVQHWLECSAAQLRDLAGVFFWSFYRGKDSDVCLRQMHAYAEGLTTTLDVSASYCVDQLVPLLRRECWAIVLDGAEVVQHEQGSWLGRFIHPELGRLVEELASAPTPGLLVLTTRFPLPTLERRPHARILSLSTLDLESGTQLLTALGVRGSSQALVDAAKAAGLHAKAVELLGTYLRRYWDGQAGAHTNLPAIDETGASAEEIHVARVLAGFQQMLTPELRDILSLAVAFRQPPAEARLLEYLKSAPVARLLHELHHRDYAPFTSRPDGWLAAQLEELIDLRLLERVGLALVTTDEKVLDTHPLVRRGFENVLRGDEGAHARAGFLRGRPDRRPPDSLADAREEVELFHAYCDAGLWSEADSTIVALDNPKHRFLAPAFERDLLLRFFPNGDFRQAPLWSGFGRNRSLAICLELLGQFGEALEVYRTADAPLRGDALIALGRLQVFVDQPQVPAPWQALWQAYRAHALCLLGRTQEALTVAQNVVPVDIYEWVHVFECLLRLGRLDVLDISSLLYRKPFAEESRWASLARRRMHADVMRVRGDSAIDLGREYRELIDEYDKAGLPYERALTRLSYGRLLIATAQDAEARAVAMATVELARRHEMTILERDAFELCEQVEGTKVEERLRPSRP